MNTDNKQLWHEVLNSIKVSVSAANYSTWFTQTHLISIKENGDRAVAEVGCNSSFVKATIEARYFGLIQDVLSKTVSVPCDLLFIVKQYTQTSSLKDKPIAPLFNTDESSESKDYNEALKHSGVRPIYTFDNFAVSSSNQMAWAAAEAVAGSPGTAYNPLFIWGGVGVGKTHLMNSVGCTMIKKDKDTKVLSCTGEDFTNDIVEGIRNKTTQAFRNKYRKLNALFIDDIQFIAGKDAVQEEFFHTFNAIVRAGGQIILTSDRTPSEISKLEERLRSRFEAGLIVDISPPDFELRCAITQIKSQDRGLEIPMDLVQLIAGNIDSARKIEGFQELVESLLGKGIEQNGNNISKAGPNELISAVAKHYSIGKRTLLGTTRARPVARPRQVLMYLLRTHTLLPLQEVGRIVGGRDHTTVMHAVEKITQLASTNVQIREDIQWIKNSV